MADYCLWVALRHENPTGDSLRFADGLEPVCDDRVYGGDVDRIVAFKSTSKDDLGKILISLLSRGNRLYVNLTPQQHTPVSIALGDFQEPLAFRKWESELVEAFLDLRLESIDFRHEFVSFLQATHGEKVAFFSQLYNSPDLIVKVRCPSTRSLDRLVESLRNQRGLNGIRTFVIARGFGTGGETPRQLANLDMTGRVMLAIAATKDATMSSVRNAVGLPSSTAHRILRALELRGLVVSQEGVHPSHGIGRPSKAYRLTASGQATLSALQDSLNKARNSRD